MIKKFCYNLKGSLQDYSRIHSLNSVNKIYSVNRLSIHNRNLFMTNQVISRYFNERSSKNRRDHFKDEEEIMDEFYDKFEKPKQSEKDLDEKMRSFKDKEAFYAIIAFVVAIITFFNVCLMLSRKRVEYIQSKGDETKSSQDKMIEDLEQQLKELKDQDKK